METAAPPQGRRLGLLAGAPLGLPSLDTPPYSMAMSELCGHTRALSLGM